MGGGVPSPALSVLLHYSLARSGHSGGFVPPGQLCHSRGVDALRQLEYSLHSPASPPCVFRHPGGLATPLLSPTLKGSLATSESVHSPTCPPLLRTFRPVFPPACDPTPYLWPRPMPPPPPLPPCWRPRKWPSQCCYRRPPRPHIALPCRCPTPPTPFPSASLFPTPPPSRSLTPPPSPTPPISRRSTRHFRLRSPPGLLLSPGTPPCSVYD